MSQDLVSRFLSQNSFAVVGASRDRSKFGNIVFRDLREKGFHVLAVNPTLTKVEGSPCYPNLQSLPEPVDAIICVVPPSATEKVVEEAHAVGIHYVWLQPGAESQKAVDYCRNNGIDVVYDDCVMVRALSKR